MNTGNGNALTDLSPMPFGDHKGKPMQEVPASYFHWLWQAGKRFEHNDPVANYIRENIMALKDEFPDGIWS